MNAKVSACLWGAIELHFLWNKVFSTWQTLTKKDIKLNDDISLSYEKNGVLLHLKTSHTMISTRLPDPPTLTTNVQVIQNI